MSTDVIDALSPLDGRYAAKLGPVREIFSEAGLMRERVRVECAWLLALAAGAAGEGLAGLPAGARDFLEVLARDPAGTDVAAIKTIESRTNHDVKAVELWLREQLTARGAAPAHLEWVHFGCTSEDINNLSYALMLKRARATVLLPMLGALGTTLEGMAARHACIGMLSRTHGQTATPTTVGKEMANVAVRLAGQRATLARVAIAGKMNGAVGNFNAHVTALPHVDWLSVSTRFIESMDLVANLHTTQIEPHDWIAEYCHALMRANTVLLDLARDMWTYISLGYFKQRMMSGEVGSSTMPHKVNPIDFENAEGNLGLANALLGFFADKLPISRLQRDLTDSTVLRNLGVAIGHSALAYRSLAGGLQKVELDTAHVARDLERAWEVLAEAIQTVMRAHGIPDAYDKLKAYTRGQPMNQATMHAFIGSLALPEEDIKRLLALTPGSYLGLAPLLAIGMPQR